MERGVHVRSHLRATMVVAAFAALATGVLAAPAAADGVRTDRAGDSGAARMVGECTDPGFVGAIRFRNPLGLYDVDCIRPESVRYPGPVFVTHCKPTNGGRLNLHMPGGEVLECPATVYRDAIGYSAWA